MGKVNAKTLQKLCLNRVLSIKNYCIYREIFRKTKPSVSYRRRKFNLDIYTDSECLLYFRFSKSEIQLLQTSLKIPRVCWLPNGIKFTGVEGLCILLRRLSYPNRFYDLVCMFSRDETALGKIFNSMLAMIYPTAFSNLSTLSQKYLTPEKIIELAENCVEAGCPYPNIIGFIDGTARRICKPTYDQKDMYSGYKKQHVVKYQSVVLSNGLIGRLDGPFAGRRHDAAVLHLSGLLQEMEQKFVNQDGTWFAIFGDVGYSNQRFIKVGYKNHTRLSSQQKSFNATMAGLRVGVEYGFGKIIQQFAYLDFYKNQQIYLAPIRKMYFVAAFLTNCQTCIRQTTQVADIFNSSIPTLSEYLE